MGNYRRYTEIIQPVAQPSGTAAQTVTFKMSRQSRRLTGLFIRVTPTTASSLPANTDGDGLAAVVNEVRFNISDVRGDRAAVKASGPALLTTAFNNDVFPDRSTQVGYAGTGFPTSTAVPMIFPIFLAHPKIPEPLCYQLGMPFSDRFMAIDPTIEVDLNAVAAGASNVFVTNGCTWGSNAMELLAVYHEVPETVPYIPWQLTTEVWAPTVTSKVPYEWSNVGVLLQALFQTYTDGTWQQRVSPLSSGGTMQLNYGTNQYGNLHLDWLTYLNDQTRPTYPASVSAVIASSFLFERCIGGEFFYDFMTDRPGPDLFAVAAAFNLDQRALAGDKMRLFFNDLASTAYRTRVTNFRLMPDNMAQVASLLAG